VQFIATIHPFPTLINPFTGGFYAGIAGFSGNSLRKSLILRFNPQCSCKRMLRVCGFGGMISIGLIETVENLDIVIPNLIGNPV